MTNRFKLPRQEVILLIAILIIIFLKFVIFKEEPNCLDSNKQLKVPCDVPLIAKPEEEDSDQVQGSGEQ